MKKLFYSAVIYSRVAALMLSGCNELEKASSKIDIQVDPEEQYITIDNDSLFAPNTPYSLKKGDKIISKSGHYLYGPIFGNDPQSSISFKIEPIKYFGKSDEYEVFDLRTKKSISLVVRTRVKDSYERDFKSFVEASQNSMPWVRSLFEAKLFLPIEKYGKTKSKKLRLCPSIRELLFIAKNDVRLESGEEGMISRQYLSSVLTRLDEYLEYNIPKEEEGFLIDALKPTMKAILERFNSFSSLEKKEDKDLILSSCIELLKREQEYYEDGYMIIYRGVNSKYLKLITVNSILENSKKGKEYLSNGDFRLYNIYKGEVSPYEEVTAREILSSIVNDPYSSDNNNPNISLGLSAGTLTLFGNHFRGGESAIQYWLSGKNVRLGAFGDTLDVFNREILSKHQPTTRELIELSTLSARDYERVTNSMAAQSRFLGKSLDEENGAEICQIAIPDGDEQQAVAVTMGFGSLSKVMTPDRVKMLMGESKNPYQEALLEFKNFGQNDRCLQARFFQPKGAKAFIPSKSFPYYKQLATEWLTPSVNKYGNM